MGESIAEAKGRSEVVVQMRERECSFPSWEDFMYDWTTEPERGVLRMRSGGMSRNLLLKSLADQGRNPGLLQRTIWSCYSV